MKKPLASLNLGWIIHALAAQGTFLFRYKEKTPVPHYVWGGTRAAQGFLTFEQIFVRGAQILVPALST